MKQDIHPLILHNVPETYPPARLYLLPVVRIPRGPFRDPPYLPQPYSPLTADAAAITRDTVADAAAVHEAGFAQRTRQGQLPGHSGPLTRPAPAPSPELYTGRLVDTSL
ncbi:hypothetical protein Dde_2463 [Oleidesulfovibrio alaskensis G20]|jgi:hypothetical protein|uniref:Uncharacterized protein n=1 Tax=Oleidesulfovibrio alaskensis (strain ATCC BAA-1058 / DSM 17464 / G20) TaxID=207559 RepID=Q30YI6_OLEA2|nr:hypothetical protein [Oleidesulfovibrio alaskensis]ABB39260.1 hypothetical protein Dde_2463 [Oleidesulfovibrio alaskensis G20]MBG0771985.1 hypothetical protein [Oleidesulfovibrio alaskensis]MBL3581777.1 hypothetical protein [Oleidesulfovibrio alaskensis]